MTGLLSNLRVARLPAGAEALRSEVRAFMRDTLPAVTTHAKSRSWMGFDAQFSRALAARGWVGVTLPRQ